MTKTPHEQLKQAALDLGMLRPKNEDEKGIVGMLLGAVYALDQASRHRFEDRTGGKLPNNYAEELAGIATAIGKGSPPTEGQWLAGFYLNSAMQRLAPVAERMGKYIGMRQDLVPEVREEVNKLKHDVEGLMSGRKVTLLKAIDAAMLLVAAAQAITSNMQENG